MGDRQEVSEDVSVRGRVAVGGLGRVLSDTGV